MKETNNFDQIQQKGSPAKGKLEHYIYFQVLLTGQSFRAIKKQI